RMPSSGCLPHRLHGCRVQLFTGRVPAPAVHRERKIVMIPVLGLLLMTATPAPPLNLLQQVRDHYRSLSSFAMRVENQDGSSLFPGRYSQTLRWRRGGRFELRVTSKGNTRVPDYYADGKQVLSIRPGNVWITGELMPDANTMPGWEVSGG